MATDTNTLTNIISSLVGLSVATERVVEIVKGYIPWLNVEKTDADAEGRRRATLHVLSVIAGVVTAELAASGNALPDMVSNATNPMGVIALGLLASGGSGFWNSALTYVKKAKDLKEIAVETAKANAGGAVAARAGN